MNTSIQVIVRRSTLIAKMSNAANITHSVDQALVLDASESYDPDMAILSYSWTCFHPDSSLPCVDANGNGLVLSNSPTITIPASNLKSDGVYSFTVRVTAADGRIANASTLINIQPSGSFTITITVQYQYSTSTVQLSAESAASGLVYQWASNSINLASSSAVLSTSTTLPTLLISYATLAGNSYAFSVIGINSAGQSASASATIVIPHAPRGGSCVATPPRGNALTTSFTLACPDWQVGDSASSTSLSYVFSYVLDGAEMALGSARYVSSVQTYLPAPSITGTQLKIVARIIGEAPFLISTIYNFSVIIDLPVRYHISNIIEFY